MGQKVQFEGTLHEFPDEFTADDISNALTGYTAEPKEPAPLPTEVQAARNFDAGHKADHGRANIGVLKEDPKIEQFRSIIQRIETGEGDPWVRTRIRPTGIQKGSSAFGPYQITRKLLSEQLNKYSHEYSTEELDAMDELVKRQQVALEIGGRDRPRYEQGGGLYVQARMWAKDFGYEDTKTFLDDFDYGGSLGLSDDVAFQVAYEQAARKMLGRVLGKYSGNEEAAAAEWHGGAGWQKAAHRKRTEGYQRKYRSYRLEISNEGTWSPEDLAALRD